MLSQSDEHSGQIARLTTELEQSHKKNSEMKREINERKVLSNQLQEVGRFHEIFIMKVKSTLNLFSLSLSFRTTKGGWENCI